MHQRPRNPLASKAPRPPPRQQQQAQPARPAAAGSRQQQERPPWDQQLLRLQELVGAHQAKWSDLDAGLRWGLVLLQCALWRSVPVLLQAGSHAAVLLEGADTSMHGIYVACLCSVCTQLPPAMDVGEEAVSCLWSLAMWYLHCNPHLAKEAQRKGTSEEQFLEELDQQCRTNVLVMDSSPATASSRVTLAAWLASAAVAAGGSSLVGQQLWLHCAAGLQDGQMLFSGVSRECAERCNQCEHGRHGQWLSGTVMSFTPSSAVHIVEVSEPQQQAQQPEQQQQQRPRQPRPPQRVTRRLRLHLGACLWHSGARPPSCLMAPNNPILSPAQPRAAADAGTRKTVPANTKSTQRTEAKQAANSSQQHAEATQQPQPQQHKQQDDQQQQKQQDQQQQQQQPDMPAAKGTQQQRQKRPREDAADAAISLEAVTTHPLASDTSTAAGDHPQQMQESGGPEDMVLDGQHSEQQALPAADTVAALPNGTSAAPSHAADSQQPLAGMAAHGGGEAQIASAVVKSKIKLQLARSVSLDMQQRRQQQQQLQSACAMPAQSAPAATTAASSQPAVTHDAALAPASAGGVGVASGVRQAAHCPCVQPLFEQQALQQPQQQPQSLQQTPHLHPAPMETDEPHEQHVLQQLQQVHSLQQQQQQSHAAPLEAGAVLHVQQLPPTCPSHHGPAANGATAPVAAMAPAPLPPAAAEGREASLQTPVQQTASTSAMSGASASTGAVRLPPLQFRAGMSAKEMRDGVRTVVVAIRGRTAPVSLAYVGFKNMPEAEQLRSYQALVACCAAGDVGEASSILVQIEACGDPARHKMQPQRQGMQVKHELSGSSSESGVVKLERPPPGAD